MKFIFISLFYLASLCQAMPWSAPAAQPGKSCAAGACSCKMHKGGAACCCLRAQPSPSRPYVASCESNEEAKAMPGAKPHLVPASLPLAQDAAAKPRDIFSAVFSSHDPEPPSKVPLIPA